MSSSEPSKPVVLVADDDEALRLLFSRALSLAGFDTLTAATGHAALEAVDNRPVHLVVLDSRMPGMDGRHVLSELRARPRLARLPVLLVTGETEARARTDYLAAGADDYLVKPVDIVDLVTRVRSRLGL